MLKVNLLFVLMFAQTLAKIVSSNYTNQLSFAFKSPEIWGSDFTIDRGFENINDYPIGVGNFSGDRFADIFRVFKGRCDNSSSRMYYANSTGNSFNNFGFYTGSLKIDQQNTPTFFGDINGDGLTDIVQLQPAVNAFITNTSRDSQVTSNWGYNYLNTGFGMDFQQFTPRFLADVTGDRMADLIGIKSDGSIYVYPSTGTQFYSNVIPPIWLYNFFWGNDINLNPISFADVNGDGIADLVAFLNDGVYVALSLKTRFGSPLKWSDNFCLQKNWKTFDQHPRIMGDVNGDGKADIIGFRNDVVIVSYSNGTSFDSVQIGLDNFVIDDGESQNFISYNKYPRLVADFDGDGKADIIAFGKKYLWVARSQSNRV